MKTKVLTSHYSGESGYDLHRVYLEPDFDQAQRDLDMILGTNPNQSFQLREAELFQNKAQVWDPKEESHILTSIHTDTGDGPDHSATWKPEPIQSELLKSVKTSDRKTDTPF